MGKGNTNSKNKHFKKTKGKKKKKFFLTIDMQNSWKKHCRLFPEVCSILRNTTAARSLIASHFFSFLRERTVYSKHFLKNSWQSKVSNGYLIACFNTAGYFLFLIFFFHNPSGCTCAAMFPPLILPLASRYDWRIQLLVTFRNVCQVTCFDLSLQTYPQSISYILKK